VKRIIVILLVVAAVAGGSWLLYSRGENNVSTGTGLPEGFRTAPVIRDSIKAVINTTGSLSAERMQALSFTMAGEVTEVMVGEGDHVVAGQVLARLDGEDLELGVKQAQVALQVSEAQLARALKGPSEEEIASAEAALASAQANLEDLKAGPSSRDKELARLAIDQAKNSRWGAQGNRDAIVGGRFSSDAQKDQVEAQVLNAEIGVKIAELQYEQMLEPPKTSAIKTAEAQVAQAESALAKLRSMPSAEDVAVAEAQVAQARVGLEGAQRRLDDLEFTAPFGGELATWDLHVGDHVAPGTPVGTLIDTSRYYLDVRIDETEIAQVRVGQIAYITLDAYPEDALEGQVSKVDLIGTNNQGIIEYGVRITLPENDLDLKPLMTAAVGIVVEEKPDVLLVPNRGIRRDKEGKYVEILRDNMPARVSIETGLTSEEHTEVLSGLEEGQEVIIAKPRADVFPGTFGG